MAMETRLDSNSIFLWTLPMFHCNGWCFPWGVTAAGAVHLCLRKFDPATALQLLNAHQCTVMTGVPTMYIALLEAAKTNPERPGDSPARSAPSERRRDG